MHESRELVALIARVCEQVIQQHSPPIGNDGVVVPGSWNPGTGEVDVLVGDTAAIAPTADEQPLVMRGLQMQTPVRGMQAGPTGGERVVLQPSDSGYRAILEHGQDDSPGAPAGEFWYVNPVTGAWIKFTRDGVTQGDGKGGVRLGGPIGYVNVQVQDGAETIAIELDTTARQVRIGNATIQLVLDFKTGRISFAGNGIGLGAIEGFGNGDQVVTQSYLQTALNAMQTAVQSAINQTAANAEAGAGCQPGTVPSVTATGSQTVSATP